MPPIVEDALAGVEAGRRGGFSLVLGIDRASHAKALLEHGADVVVNDLSELLPPPTPKSRNEQSRIGEELNPPERRRLVAQVPPLRSGSRRLAGVIVHSGQRILCHPRCGSGVGCRRRSLPGYLRRRLVRQTYHPNCWTVRRERKPRQRAQLADVDLQHRWWSVVRPRQCRHPRILPGARSSPGDDDSISASSGPTGPDDAYERTPVREHG